MLRTRFYVTLSISMKFGILGVFGYDDINFALYRNVANNNNCHKDFNQ